MTAFVLQAHICAGLTCLHSVQRDDSMTQELSALLLNHESEVGHLRQQDLLNITQTSASEQLKHTWVMNDMRAVRSDLLEDERLLVPLGVDGVGRRAPFGAVFAFGVFGQTDELDLHSGFHVLIRQELTGVNLNTGYSSQSHVHVQVKKDEIKLDVKIFTDSEKTAHNELEFFCS